MIITSSICFHFVCRLVKFFFFLFRLKSITTRHATTWFIQLFANDFCFPLLCFVGSNFSLVPWCDRWNVASHQTPQIQSWSQHELRRLAGADVSVTAGADGAVRSQAESDLRGGAHRLQLQPADHARRFAVVHTTERHTRLDRQREPIHTTRQTNDEVLRVHQMRRHNQTLNHRARPTRLHVEAQRRQLRHNPDGGSTQHSAHVQSEPAGDERKNSARLPTLERVWAWLQAEVCQDQSSEGSRRRRSQYSRQLQLGDVRRLTSALIRLLLLIS